ncbi:MAG: hydantoinase B/oxoprolinase family protein [Thermodesulfobacteriota bacterium]
MTSVVDIEVFNGIFTSIAEEMGIILARSAFSSNMKERRDFSCALFDREGEMIAQAAHIPVHLGSLAATLAHIRRNFTLAPGDIAISNDPYGGGSHLPDITLVEGVFAEDGELLFHVLNRAHHADVGGASPGSMGLASSIAAEGVRIEPSLLQRAGRPDQLFLQSFLARVRNPEERLGDLRAQQAALTRGKKRLLDLAARHGHARLREISAGLQDYSERVMRATIRTVPDGCYRFTDHLDDGGAGAAQPLAISVELTIQGEEALVDFRQSAPQVASPVNTVASVTGSATIYVFQCLAGNTFPINSGSSRPLRILTRPGTLLDAVFPAPVAAGNVETSQRIVDVLMGALAQAIPERIGAASCGSMNNIAIGGIRRDGRPYTYYETIGGGMGGRPSSAGLSGIHTHMTNTMNTPVEALEHSYPFLVTRYGLRLGSGGRGRNPGGDGIVRSYRFLEPAELSLLTDRRRFPPYGLAGGGPGKKGVNILERQGKKKRMPGKVSIETRPGDILHISTPGGGGWGRPDRDSGGPRQADS